MPGPHPHPSLPPHRGGRSTSLRRLFDVRLVSLVRRLRIQPLIAGMDVRRAWTMPSSPESSATTVSVAGALRSVDLSPRLRRVSDGAGACSKVSHSRCALPPWRDAAHCFERTGSSVRAASVERARFSVRCVTCCKTLKDGARICKIPRPLATTLTLSWRETERAIRGDMPQAPPGYGCLGTAGTPIRDGLDSLMITGERT